MRKIKSKRKVISGMDHQGLSVRVIIDVNDNHAVLTKNELEKLSGHMAEQTMHNVVNAPFIRIPLYKIRVR